MCQLRRPRNNDSIKMCTFNIYVMISKHYFPLKGTRAPRLILNLEQRISLESGTTSNSRRWTLPGLSHEKFAEINLQGSLWTSGRVMMQYNPSSMIKILCPPDAKNWLIGKDPDVGKDWRWEEKGTTEDEIVGWHRWLDAHEFE